ncbi:hypothetical protein VTJ49DRAFT_6823 [Mycothermus thermophilus]|uniref:Uncharacterized protein n=1 Tax=Humicola insolens TaxID=85995 RepID=A0ABR3V283_HUMIN
MATAATTTTTATTIMSAKGVATAAGAIGGIAPPAIENSGDSARPFKINEFTFATRDEAVQRACAIQNNACADAVNRGQVQGKTVPDCNAQETQCRTDLV